MTETFTIINTRADLLARVRERARAEGRSMGRVAGRAVTEVLPQMQASWEDLTWPAPKVYRSDGVRHCTLEVRLESGVLAAYKQIATDLVVRAVRNSTVNIKPDPIDGSLDATGRWHPYRWVIQQALHEAFMRGQSPAKASIPTERPPRADGPLMSLRLPVKLIDWARSRGSVSAFIRGAVESQLSVVCVHDKVPPKSQLLHHEPDAPVAYRTNAQDHAYLVATAKQYGVSRAHLVRALCLMHYVHLHKRTAQAHAQQEPAAVEAA